MEAIDPQGKTRRLYFVINVKGDNSNAMIRFRFIALVEIVKAG
jgi:hypothetical protein